MAFSFPWPLSHGEWLAWWAAAATVVLGLLVMFAPRLSLRLLGLEAARRGALVMPRCLIGGFYVGFGMAAILLAQPFIYLALGAAWAVAAFGCVVSLLSDGAATLHGWLFLLLSLALAALTLAFALGFAA